MPEIIIQRKGKNRGKTVMDIMNFLKDKKERKRLKRFIAVLSAVAMMITSFNIPVYAKTGEEIIVEESDSVTAEESAAFTETTEDVTEKEEKDISENAAESASVKGVGNISETKYYEVHNMEELQQVIVSAPNGVETTIHLEEPYSMANDVKKYYVSGNLVIPARKNIVIDMNSQSFSYNGTSGVSCNEADPFRMIISENAFLKLVSNSGYGTRMGVENNGTFVMDGPTINPQYGHAIKNNKGAKAVVETGCLKPGVKYYGIFNEGEAILNQANIRTDYSEWNEETGKLMKPAGGIYNAGCMTLEQTEMSATGNTISINGIDNIGENAVLSIRGAYNIKLQNRQYQGIRNISGKVEIGAESRNTFIDGIRTFGGGIVTMRSGKVTRVITAACMGDERDSNLEDGNFIMIGGDAYRVFYDKNLPELKFGETGFASATNQPAIVKISENGIDSSSDITSYKYKTHSDTGEQLVEKSIYEEDAEGTIEYEGKRYIVAYKIINGKPIFYNKEKYTTISTNEAFRKAAKEGGSYYITKNIYVSENVIVEKDLELDGEDVFFRSVTTLNGEYKAGSLTVAKGATLYSATIFKQSSDQGKGSLSADRPFITNNGMIEDLYAIQCLDELKKDGSGAVALENNGRILSVEIDQNTQGVSENRPVGIQNNTGGVIEWMTSAIGNECAVAVKNEGEIQEGYIDTTSDCVFNLPIVVNEASGKISDIWGFWSGTKGILVDNSGEFQMNTGYKLWVSTGVAIKNSGTLVMNGGNIYAQKGGTAVENTGTFVMYGGVVGNISRGQDHAYAITYTEGHEPVLIGGTVYGSRYDKSVSTNAAEGSAVVKWNGETAEKGFFKHTVTGTPIDSLNAAKIIDGNISYDSTVSMKWPHYYALMEKGESVKASDMFDISTWETIGSSISGNTYTFSSKDESVVSCSKVSGNDVFTAVDTGTAMVMVSSNETKAADYVIIDVVEEGGRAKLVADSYEVNLFTENMTMNANQSLIRVSYEWHLKENATGVEKYFNWNDNFWPSGMIITGKSVDSDKDFNTYFTREETTKYNLVERRYLVRYIVETDNNGGNPVTLLARDGVTGFKDLNVTLTLRNKASGKTFEIPVAQKLNLSIDQSAPCVQFDTVNLNGAYNTEAVYKLNGTSVPPNLISNADLKSCVKGDMADKLKSVSIKSYPNGFDGDGTNLYYEGGAKNKKVNIPVKVTFNEYVGSFDAVVPVSVKSVYPKVSPEMKTITVPEKATHMEDIKLRFIDKKSPLGVGTVKNVEIVGNSSFQLIAHTYSGNNGVYYNETDKCYYAKKDSDDCTLTLRPRADLTKAETVALKVTYGNLKRKSGKEYSTIVKLKVKPVSEKKHTLKVNEKPVLYISENAEKTGVIGTSQEITFQFTPSYYSNGYVKVVSADKNITVKTGESRNSLNVSANEETKITDKKAIFTVDWFAADGTKLTKKPVKVTVKFDSESPSVTVADEVTIDINKPLIKTRNIYGQLNETTNLSMGASLNLLMKNAYMDNGYYDSFDGKGLFYYDAGKIYPRSDALQAGKIVPGGDYEVKLYFKDLLENELPAKTVKIHVKEVTKVKASIVEKQVKLPKRGAAVKAIFSIHTQQPYYGMKVKSVALSGKDAGNFELMYNTNDKNKYTSQADIQYGLIYKDGRLPANLKAGNKKVVLIVTYENGATAKVKLPVVIY